MGIIWEYEHDHRTFFHTRNIQGKTITTASHVRRTMFKPTRPVVRNWCYNGMEREREPMKFTVAAIKIPNHQNVITRI